MTIQDLHVTVRMELDKLTLSSYPDFLEEEVDYFINKAYLMLINQKFTGHNELQQSFEGSTKRMMDLRNLIVTEEISGIRDTTRVQNEFVFSTSVAPEILYPVQHVVNFDLLAGGVDARTTVLITHQASNRLKHTSNNNPWIPEPALLFDSSGIKAYVDTVDILEYTGDAVLSLTYIKRPARLQYWLYDGMGNKIPNTSGDATQIPEIDGHVHQEIVSVAVDLMLDNIESQRIQTHPQLTQMKE